jgi:MFS family permease
LGQGVVWYSGQFWARYFLQQVSKVDNLTTAYIVGAGLIIGTPTLIFFGWLSDHIGRKPVILGGMLITAVCGSVQLHSRAMSTCQLPSSSRLFWLA